MPDGQPAWLHEFQAFSAHHVLVLCVSALIMGALLGVGRHWRGTPRETLWRRAWGAGIVVTQIVTITWWLLPANWDPGVSLPLHLCDLSVWVGAVALLAPSRLAACIIYFWGLGLSTQAFFTPTLQEGAAQMQYWWFWIQHTQIVGVGLYVVIVDGFRPRLDDLGAINLVTFGYLGAMLAIDIPLDLNYGYVGQADPSTATVIQRLGPWPLRLVWMAMIVEAVFLVMWAIWPLGLRRLGRPRAAPQ
jgi:hypothetical integral membrane protein (TIGR02206 family)